MYFIVSVLVQNVYKLDFYHFDHVVCIYFCACTYTGTYVHMCIFINEALQPVMQLCDLVLLFCCQLYDIHILPSAVSACSNYIHY